MSYKKSGVPTIRTMLLILIVLFVSLSSGCVTQGGLCSSNAVCCTRPCSVAVCNRMHDNRTKSCHYLATPCFIHGQACDRRTGSCIVVQSIPSTPPRTVDDADLSTIAPPTLASPPHRQHALKTWTIVLGVSVCVFFFVVVCVGFYIYMSKNAAKSVVRPGGPLYTKVSYI